MKHSVLRKASVWRESIWKYLYSFPQTPEYMIEAGYQEIYNLWCPILDVFKENDVRFALEVHPAEIAFDYYPAKRLLEKFADRLEFGLNFDPSHLIWQGITPHIFLADFINRVYHVHMKDAAAFVRRVDFKPSDFKFDDAIAN